MAWRLVFAFIALSTVHCKDLIIGEDGGNLIWTEVVSASPLIPWAKTDHVYVETDDENEFISKIVVTDKYPEKPGDVEILEGGVGEGDVLIEFSRKGIFRGFEFYVEVYSKHDDSVPPHKPHEHADKVPPKVPEDVPSDASVIPVPKTSGDSATANAPASTNVPVLSSSEVNPGPSEAALGSAAVTSSPSEAPQVLFNVPKVFSVPLSTPTGTDLPIASDAPAANANPEIIGTTPVDSNSAVTPVTPINSTAIPVVSSDSTNSPVASSDSTVTPFVNTDTQTALVGLVIPDSTRIRRQVFLNSNNNNSSLDNSITTELYDEGTEDYSADLAL